MYVDEDFRDLIVQMVTDVALRRGPFSRPPPSQLVQYLENETKPAEQPVDKMIALLSEYLNRHLLFKEEQTIHNEKPEWGVAKKLLGAFRRRAIRTFKRRFHFDAGEFLIEVLSQFPELGAIDIERFNKGKVCAHISFTVREVQCDTTLNLDTNYDGYTGLGSAEFKVDGTLVASILLRNLFLDIGACTFDDAIGLQHEIKANLKRVVALREYLEMESA